LIVELLNSAVASRLAKLAEERGLSEPPPVVSAPPPKHLPGADISFPWPLAAAKKLKIKPLELAEACAQAVNESVFQPLGSDSKAKAAPPGFLNIELGPGDLARNLGELLADPCCGCRDADTPARRILLEYVSANPTGPVHLASGRAATLGDCLARILKRRGHKVRTEYYINDAGRQVRLLGASVKARFEQINGKDTPIPEGGYQGEYIKDMAADAPADAAEWTETEFSQYAVDRMLGDHKADMALFGARFDRWFLESELHQAKKLDKALETLRAKGRVFEKDGAVWLGSAGEDSEDDKDRVLVRSDGTPTYFLADIAYHEDKFERGNDELIDIWGADHHGYVPRMKEAVAALGRPKGSFKVIVHQLVRLFRGKEAVRMSKRAGEFISLRELVKEAGLDACRFFFAMRTPNAHMNFDVELAKKQTNENPVFYVQYVHARICSIFREAVERGLLDPGAGVDADLEALKVPEERALLVKLAWFPEALRNCERDLSPVPLPTYLMDLGGLYHKFYEVCRVLDPEDPELSRARLALCAGVRAVIGDGLSLLGVSAPEKM